eukprot:TRINITY_DN27782_c0_g5_i1.p1 TRINITY_DN27782_c0_g5~~TRINITY_DN27782_c0_g5_i1.p1  ORF type:complete len:581 (+),score=102.37 TRINITY_DN27782_c0_g5_i1:151-1743(+)
MATSLNASEIWTQGRSSISPSTPLSQSPASLRPRCGAALVTLPPHRRSPRCANKRSSIDVGVSDRSNTKVAIAPESPRVMTSPSGIEPTTESEVFFNLVAEKHLRSDLREAFVRCGGEGNLAIPNTAISSVLQEVGLLDGNGDETFCAVLASVLDKEECGFIALESMLNFLLGALHCEEIRGAGGQISISSSPTMGARGASSHLEQLLTSAAAKRLLNGRLKQLRGELASCYQVRPAAPTEASKSTAAVASSISASIPKMTSETTLPVADHETKSSVVAHEATIASSRLTSPSHMTTISAPAPSGPRSTPPRPALPASCKEAPRTAASRCNLLYEQALLALRESAEYAETVRRLREEQEMLECTFSPRLCSRRRPSPAASQPKNYCETICRMRAANRRRLERREARERIPRGENYERLRRLGSKPFSFYFKGPVAVASRPVEPPLLCVDVHIGEGIGGRICVHDGDDLHVLAHNFSREFCLVAELEARLEASLHEACDKWPPLRRKRQINVSSDVEGELHTGARSGRVVS